MISYIEKSKFKYGCHVTQFPWPCHIYLGLHSCQSIAQINQNIFTGILQNLQGLVPSVFHLICRSHLKICFYSSSPEEVTDLSRFLAWRHFESLNSTGHINRISKKLAPLVTMSPWVTKAVAVINNRYPGWFSTFFKHKYFIKRKVLWPYTGWW